MLSPNLADQFGALADTVEVIIAVILILSRSGRTLWSGQVRISCLGSSLRSSRKTEVEGSIGLLW